MTRILAITLLLAFSAGAATAQGPSEEKFCAQIKGEPGKPPSCTFKTMAQCEEAVKSDQGTCLENPKLKGKM